MFLAVMHDDSPKFQCVIIILLINYFVPTCLFYVDVTHTKATRFCSFFCSEIVKLTKRIYNSHVNKAINNIKFIIIL